MNLALQRSVQLLRIGRRAAPLVRVARSNSDFAANKKDFINQKVCCIFDERATNSGIDVK